LRTLGERARHRGVADPQAHAVRRRLMAELSRAAEEFAAGGDGTPMVPSEMRSNVERWNRELSRRGLTLDRERWLLGLLTLACLARSPRAKSPFVAAPAVREPMP